MKKFLNILLVLSLVVFLLGQLAKISLTDNIKISLLDIIIFLYVLISVIYYRKIKNSSTLLIPGYLFIAVSLISSLFNSFRSSETLITIGFLYLARFTVYFMFYIELNKIKDRKIISLIGTGLLMAGLTVAVLGLVQFFLYPDLRNLIYLGWDPHFYRLFSTFLDPNFTGVILVLTFFRLLSFDKKIKSRILYIALVIFLLITILLTRSRTAYLSLISGFIVFFFNYRTKINYKTAGLAGFFALVIFLIIPTAKVDVFDLFRIYSSIARLNNWRLAFEMGMKNFLLGAGFGPAKFSDSSFLYVFAASGIWGLLSYSYFWFKTLRIGKNILVITTVLIVSSFFNNTLFYPWILYWLYMELVISARN